MFATVVVTVRPDESRTTIGSPGSATQTPRAETVKLPPLAATKSADTLKALDAVLETV